MFLYTLLTLYYWIISDKDMASATEILEWINEGRCWFLLPVIRQALEMLGEDQVWSMLMTSLHEHGTNCTSNGEWLRTVGGIFIKKLKEMKEKKYIFNGQK